MVTMTNAAAQKRESDLRLKNCPVTVTIDVIGGKWKPLIVFYLLQRTHRFGELKRLLTGVTQQMLTTQLRELERDGVIHREVYAQVPPKVEYSLTSLGRSLDPIIEQMYRWGERFLERATPESST